MRPSAGVMVVGAYFTRRRAARAGSESAPFPQEVLRVLLGDLRVLLGG